MARGMLSRFRGRRTSSSENVMPEEPRKNGQKPSSARKMSSKQRHLAASDGSISMASSSSALDAANPAASAPASTQQQQEQMTDQQQQQQAPPKRRHGRRKSLGDVSIDSSAMHVDPSPKNSTSHQKARFMNSRKSLRRRSMNKKKAAAGDHAEEEKKEIPSESGEHDEEPLEEEDEDDDEEDADDFFESPEFQSRVAHEAADLDKEGNTYFERGDYDQAFMSYERALKLKRASLQVDKKAAGTQDMLTETESQKASILASVATSINNMTYLRQRAGQASADETMAAYLKSLQIKREILGPNHLSVGKTLNNIGSVFYLKKEYIPALKAYENAHEIMSEQLGATNLDVGTVLSNIGDVHSAMGHKRDALLYYRMALDIRWSQLGRYDPKVIRLMEQTAALETGKQPRKRSGELSDSEGEEYAEEDRKRRKAFQEECQALQEELVEDIKFFDLVERTLAIESVKQKTKFMRAMRKVQTGGSIRSDMFENAEMFENNEFDADDDASDASSMSVMSAPPDLDLDGDDSGDEAPEVLAFLQEIGANNRNKAPVKKGGKPKPMRHKSMPPGPQTPPKPVAERSPKTPNSSTPSTQSTTPGNTPPRNRPPEQARTPPNGRRVRPPSVRTDLDDEVDDGPSTFPRMGANGSLLARSKNALTPDERMLATWRVKERVASIRSKREQEEADMDPEEVAEMRRREMMRSKRRAHVSAIQEAVEVKRKAALEAQPQAPAVK